MTMVVMIAAKNTKPPKAPNAIIAPKFNLAPCVSRCRSFSTKYGMFTFGDWSDLEYEQIETLEFHPFNIFSSDFFLFQKIQQLIFPNDSLDIDTASDFIVLWMCSLDNIVRTICGWCGSASCGSAGCCLSRSMRWSRCFRFVCGRWIWICMPIFAWSYRRNNRTTWNNIFIHRWYDFFFFFGLIW